MVVLKSIKSLNYLMDNDYRVKASTLMETLVATVLIIVIFMIASMILNNLFSNTIKNNHRDINSHLNKLEYLYVNGVLEIPYHGDYKTWGISVKASSYRGNKNQILFEVINKETKQYITRHIIEH